MRGLRRRMVQAVSVDSGRPERMEAFEQFVALALEDEGLIVSSALKFSVTRQTAKVSYAEVQTHGYEVDLVAARADRLVLASVKSYFGSRGIAAEDVDGTTTKQVAASGT